VHGLKVVGLGEAAEKWGGVALYKNVSLRAGFTEHTEGKGIEGDVRVFVYVGRWDDVTAWECSIEAAKILSRIVVVVRVSAQIIYDVIVAVGVSCGLKDGVWDGIWFGWRRWWRFGWRRWWRRGRRWGWRRWGWLWNWSADEARRSRLRAWDN
jgi:hypothetical protein